MKRHFTLAVCALAVLVTAAPAAAQDVTPPPQEVAAPPPPAPTPSPSPAVTASAGDGQKQDGFALQVQLGASLYSAGTGIGGTFTLPLVSGAVFAGYKLDRLYLGLGVDVSSADPGGLILLRLVPRLQFVLLRSDDGRVELFGQAELAFGHNFGNGAPGGMDFGFGVGPGIRYWAHPQFAIAAVGAFDATWDFDFDHNAHTAVTGIGAQLQMMGVF